MSKKFVYIIYMKNWEMTPEGVVGITLTLKDTFEWLQKLINILKKKYSNIENDFSGKYWNNLINYPFEKLSQEIKNNLSLYAGEWVFNPDKAPQLLYPWIRIYKYYLNELPAGIEAI